MFKMVIIPFSQLSITFFILIECTRFDFIFRRKFINLNNINLNYINKILLNKYNE